ncbi:Bypass of stop codon protein 5 [Candida viswanathii]|uniref:Bypass of stop codon protein 5 n=1 Tax=Candida viswanathii TaxID=5486 RepID=A0A367XT27_9ASCO|nr:Bypass of stop codon protein 5 [Candida viswanathii]
MCDNEPQPPNEDELINNILPSYHMFQSTVSKNLQPTNENYSIDPPTYEMTPITSETPSLLTPSGIQSPANEPNDDNYFTRDGDLEAATFNQESEDMWKNSILANAHKLPNLTHKKNPKSEALHISIQVTETVCQAGIKPILMDPSNKEFKQGDYVHGYVTIKNTSSDPIPFDMVYVVFEGTFTNLDSPTGVVNVDEPSVRFKFLTMLDLFASWSYANIDRLVTDNGDPHDWCNGETDPYDNALLSIDVKRMFQPNVTYKRFFTFKIPEKLLDTACDQYNLPLHTEIPPTLGMDRNSFPPSLLLANQHLIVKDLSFLDSYLSYSVDARIIGKASDYKFPVKKDQYVVAKEVFCPIRVVPKPNLEMQYNRKALAQEADLYYRAFVDSVVTKVEYGNELMNQKPGYSGAGSLLRPSLSPMMSQDSVKLRQLYDVADDTIKNNLHRGKNQCDEDIYQCLIPYKKKSITGSTKHLGVISLATIKDTYKIKYTPPTRFGPPPAPTDTEVVVPLELNYFTESPTSSKTIPDIKTIDVEIVSLSIRSRKHPIPIEFTTEMLFSEKEIDIKKNKPANFDLIVATQFNNYLSEFHKLIKGIGNEMLRLETRMYQDVKCLATLKTKYINLPVSNLIYETNTQDGMGATSLVKNLPWVEEQAERGQLYTKKFSIRMNLNNCSSKSNDHPLRGLDKITLVPDFQSCYVCRAYYLKIAVRLNHGDSLVVNVPLNVYR